MKSAISLRNLSKIYRVPSLLPWKPAERTKALNSVSFDCQYGKITCLLGPNGAGKTTVVKILAGLVLPNSGRAEIMGSSLSETGYRVHGRVGLVTSNDRSFYWRLTGRQNLDFFASLHGLKGNNKKKRTMEVLSEVGLDGDADKPFRLYSSGMKQRLLLARALLGEPEIFLLDEPTAHLDPLARAEMHSLIQEKLVEKMGASVLLCTHDLAEAQELSDKLVFLNEGKIISEGSLQDLRSKLTLFSTLVMQFEEPPSKNWHENLDLIIHDAGKNRYETQIEDSGSIPDIIDAAVSKGGRLLSCHQTEPSLVEIFTRITQEPMKAHGANGLGKTVQ